MIATSSAGFSALTIVCACVPVENAIVSVAIAP
jgi:hypothetical protein